MARTDPAAHIPSIIGMNHRVDGVDTTPELAEGVRRATLQLLAGRTAEADKVLVF